MLRLLVVSLIASLLFGCRNGDEPESRAQRIVDRAIERHGGDRFEHSRITFDFRGKSFVVLRNDGMFTYRRTYVDTSGSIIEEMSNDGFVRTANGEPYQMTRREYNIWTEAVNSVVYFALLPYKLNDPAVIKRRLGREVVEGEPYDRVEVTFRKEGGGRDHDDRFVFWFHAERSTMDYLAYYYTQRGTARFRKAVNPREVGGIRFADYLNFKADSLGSEVEEAAEAFENGSLPLLSKVVLDSVRVEAYTGAPVDRISLVHENATMPMSSSAHSLLVGFALLVAPQSSGKPTPSSSQAVDLLVVNARIWTGNERAPWAEALAVRADTLAFVGTNEEAERFRESAREVVDAAGRFMTPGFIDSHVHFLDGGFRLSSVQLRDASTPEEFVARIAAYARSLPAGTWITGGDWDHELWGGDLPKKSWIDSVTSENPVWVTRLDGHMGLANSAALAAAGVPDDVAGVEGGTIVRDDGELTGLLKDNAMGLVTSRIPDPTPAQADRALDAAMDYVARHGVTSVHDAGNEGSYDGGSSVALDAFRRARDENRLKTRIYASFPLSRHADLDSLVRSGGRGDAWLRFGVLKGFVDGSLGSHTAAFLAPFSDQPDDTGLLVNTEEDLYSWISAADREELQVMTHAIGDRAIRMLLDIYERVASENGPRDRRFRIEHAQHIDPADLDRFAELGVIASMQPYHAIDDGRWAEKVIGSVRIKTTYAFRSLLDRGTRLAFGSDWFVAPPFPLVGIYAAVTRRTLDGLNEDGWVAEQKISVEEALRAYTIDAAYASFEEDIKGSLETGKLADFVMIDRDLTQIEPAAIRDASILWTVVDGRTVYGSP